MRILTIFGTRPEAIKMAMLVKKLNQTAGVNHKLCITAQHREMLDQVLNFFEIVPDYDLDLMRPGQDLTDITSRVLLKLRDVFKEFNPDLVLVHGDTTTCFAGALSAFYAGIKVGHVEAGLRTGNLLSPFPEEANRVLVSKIANFHFAPTERNRQNLIIENIDKDKILLTGNTVIDSLHFASKKINSFSNDVKDDRLKAIYNSSNKIVLITGHRRENFGDGFINICNALRTLALKYESIYFVYPVHLNPNVQKPVHEILGDLNNVHLTNPLSYPDFVYAMKNCWAILTDSGGVQEEAPGLGKPVLVMRDNTERPEAVEAGTVKLVGANSKNIIDGISNLIENQDLYNNMARANNPYGDGLAVDRIVSYLMKTSIKHL